MLRFVIKRIFQAIPAVLGISFLVFVLVRQSGDPAILMLGEGASTEALDAYRETHGLNDPVLVQYVRFLGRAMTGDLGNSLREHRPAVDVVLERLPATLQLAAGALIVPVILGMLLGVLAAVRRGSVLDYATRGMTLIGQAIPNFYLGLLLILYFGAKLQLLPTGGYGTWKHLILPSISLGLYQVAVTTRFTRTSILEVLGQPYVQTARAKGLHERAVIASHVLKNALIPIVTMLGLMVGAVLSGAVITETVFAWPGIGRLAITAILARDFPVVQAVVLMTTAIFIVVNLTVDVLYGFVDPRISH